MEQEYTKVLPGRSISSLHQYMSEEYIEHVRYEHASGSRKPRHSDSQYSSYSSNGSEHMEHFDCSNHPPHPCHSHAYRHSMHIDPLEHDRCHSDAYKHCTVPRNTTTHRCGSYPRVIKRQEPHKTQETLETQEPLLIPPPKHRTEHSGHTVRSCSPDDFLPCENVRVDIHPGDKLSAINIRISYPTRSMRPVTL